MTAPETVRVATLVDALRAAVGPGRVCLADLARERPDLWERACHLEDTLNARRDELGKDHVYLTRFGVPLREAIDTTQELLPLIDEGCDNGWCMT